MRFTIVAVAAVTAVSLLTAGCGDGEPAPTPAAPPPASAAPTVPQDLPTRVPTAAPADVTWQLVGATAVPVSRGAGPREITDATATGYAHTPDGALIAAAQLSVRAGYEAGRARWEPTITGQFLPGADRDKLLANLRAQPEPSGPSGDLSPLSGFIYQSYTPDTAVISLVYRKPVTGAHHAVTNTLRWTDDDWRMVPPPAGSWLSLSRPATDLTGVVALAAG